MFRITAETCHAFTLAEILILVAMNVENNRLASQGRDGSKSAATLREKLSAT
ncbi:MAG TPA: hypothetical protein VKF84_17690 [Candidatus Sulfotelmatobacter sp.]|nr:hypothetical protein [Candidatus Sulfotelmatobacter sp.]